MQDNVRDAVFGNVGTTISFRVSADDAPLLSKQFEPQFEPNDLLQMHNRNFIINMVIKGEKSPAFSATTLTIPVSQTNYMQHIVDSSRRKYARDRASVEAEIQELIASTTSTPAQLAPQSNTLAKKWPVDSGAKPAHKEGSGAPRHPEKQPVVPAPSSDPTHDAPKKRSRTRSRKKKPTVDGTEMPSQPKQGSDTPGPIAPSNETEIRLR